jgi:hypothetical protein
LLLLSLSWVEVVVVVGEHLDFYLHHKEVIRVMKAPPHLCIRPSSMSLQVSVKLWRREESMSGAIKQGGC